MDSPPSNITLTKLRKLPNSIRAIVLSCLVYLITFLFGFNYLSSIAIAVTIFYLFRFVESLGNIVPISNLIVVLASLQWLAGPALAYEGFSNHYKYYMYVPANEYMPFALFGVMALSLGLSLFKNKKEQFYYNSLLINISERLKVDKGISFKLIIIGLVSSFAQGFMPGSLQFIFFLLSNVMYIGVIYMLFQKSGLKWWAMGLVFFFMFVSSMQSAMFHSLLLWLAFFSFFLTIVKHYSFQRKIGIVIGGICLIYVFQIVKWEVRKGFNAGGSISTFWAVVDQKIIHNANDDVLETSGSSTESFVIRINQGWIISRIMYYIPDHESFVNGETVMDAISSSILPRFLNPTKSEVGGKVYFERFTGFQLGADTSMGASLLGEGYANFGKIGAIIFMFIYGIMISLVLKYIYKISKKYPTIILWLPLLFLQVVKAESDLVRVLNHLTKAALLVFLIYWFLGKVLKWKL